jgi:hypothetical protein
MSTDVPQSNSDWDSLAPWVKAAEWHREAPDIADAVMELANQRAQQRAELDSKTAELNRKLKERAVEHNIKMDVISLWTHVGVLILGFINVFVASLVAWHYAKSNNLIPA